ESKMSPLGCQKMSAKPCNRNAEESFPVLSLKSREQKPPNPLLIQDKDVLQPTHKVPRPGTAACAPAGRQRRLGHRGTSPAAGSLRSLRRQGARRLEALRPKLRHHTRHWPGPAAAQGTGH